MTNNPTATPKILIQGTHGAEDPEKATLPFIVGNVAATADQDTVVFLTSEAVRLATHGYADDITFGDHPPAGKILAEYVANGGRVWACGACTTPRGITAEDLVEGATIVTAANLVEALASGASTVSL
jgi:predicted peroxiredoxin